MNEQKAKCAAISPNAHAGSQIRHTVESRRKVTPILSPRHHVPESNRPNFFR